MMITTLYIALVTFSTLITMFNSTSTCQILHSPVLCITNFYSAKDIVGFVIDTFTLIWATIQLEYIVRSIILIFLPLLNYLIVWSMYMYSLILGLNVESFDNIYRLWLIGTLQGGEQALVISTLTAVFIIFPRMSREKLLVTKNGIKRVPLSTMHIASVWLANYVAKLVLGFYIREMKLESVAAWLIGLLWNPYYVLAPLHALICMLMGILIASLQCKDVDEKRRIIKYQYIRFKWSGKLE